MLLCIQGGEMNGQEFAELLITLRRRDNISQAQLAKELNVTTSAVSKWENGKNFPDISTFEKIAEFYNISFEDMHRPYDTRKRILDNINCCVENEHNDVNVGVKDSEAQNHVIQGEFAKAKDRFFVKKQFKEQLAYGFVFLLSIFVMYSWIIHEISL